MQYVGTRHSALGSEERRAIVRSEVERLREMGGEWTLRPLDERITMPMSPFEESLLELTVGPLFETISSFGIRARSEHPPYTMFFGRPYVNVTFLREAFSDVPELVELIVTSGPSTDFKMELRLSRSTLRLVLATLPMVFTVESQWSRLESQLERHYNRLDAINIEALDIDSLKVLIEEVLSPISLVARTHFQSILLSEFLFQALKGFLRSGGIEDHEVKTLKLFGGSMENVTVRTNLELSGLATLLKGCPELRSRISSEEPDHRDLESKTPLTSEEREFLNGFDEFLANYGHRDPVHNFMFPSWKEDPRTLLAVIDSMAEAEAETFREESIQKMNELRRQTERDVVRDLMRGAGRLRLLRLLLFRVLLRFARVYMALRENQQFTIGRGFPLVRRALLRLGTILAERGVLDSPFDIFFIRHKEILHEDLGSLLKDQVDIQERMKRFHVFCGMEHPMVLSGREEKDLMAELFENELPKEDETITGIGASPGVYTGRARIILDPKDLDMLEKGEVLVCHTTNPAWTPVFSMAGAIIADIGGMLSHGAVVAREFGIPAVLGTTEATRRIASGDQVEVDGGKGTVRIVTRS
jgi:phosphohistidine swiveling domain-containing protein